MLQNEFPGSRGAMATRGGWYALAAETKPCQRCGDGPAIACLPGAPYQCVCTACARLGGWSEKIIAEGLSAHSPLARIHGLISAGMGPSRARTASGQKTAQKAKPAVG
jgi:hypothetical protein